MAFGIDSDVDWELSTEGALDVEVTPRIPQRAVEPVQTH